VRDAIIASRLYLRDHGGIAYDTRDAEFSNLVAGDSACAVASVFAQSARLGRLVALTLALPVLALFAVDTLSGECYEARETAFVWYCVLGSIWIMCVGVVALHAHENFVSASLLAAILPLR
jgi:hypothetical protein